MTSTEAAGRHHQPGFAPLSLPLSLISIQLLPRVVVALPSIKSLISNASLGGAGGGGRKKRGKKERKQEKSAKEGKENKGGKRGGKKAISPTPGCI